MVNSGASGNELGSSKEVTDALNDGNQAAPAQREGKAAIPGANEAAPTKRKRNVAISGNGDIEPNTNQTSDDQAAAGKLASQTAIKKPRAKYDAKYYATRKEKLEQYDKWVIEVPELKQECQDFKQRAEYAEALVRSLISILESKNLQTEHLLDPRQSLLTQPRTWNLDYVDQIQQQLACSSDGVQNIQTQLVPVNLDYADQNVPHQPEPLNPNSVDQNPLNQKWPLSPNSSFGDQFLDLPAPSPPMLCGSGESESYPGPWDI